MPPRPKFSRETILQEAFAIVRRDGLDGLTARALAKQLESSSKVIFGYFSSMEELVYEVVQLAEEEMVVSVREALKQASPFRAVGLTYIQYACQEPQLFKILFLNETKDPINSFADFLHVKEHSYHLVIESIVEEYGLNHDLAEELYQHLFIYSHGMASLIATGIYTFSPSEIIERMTDIGQALIKDMQRRK